MGSSNSRCIENKHIELKDVQLEINCTDCRLCNSVRSSFKEDFIVDDICGCRDNVHMSCILNQIMENKCDTCYRCEKKYHWNCLDKFPEHRKEKYLDAVVLTNESRSCLFNRGLKTVYKSAEPPLDRLREVLKILDKNDINENYTFVGHYKCELDEEGILILTILFPNGKYYYCDDFKMKKVGSATVGYSGSSELFVMYSVTGGRIRSLAVFHRTVSINNVLDDCFYEWSVQNLKNWKHYTFPDKDLYMHYRLYDFFMEKTNNKLKDVSVEYNNDLNHELSKIKAKLLTKITRATFYKKSVLFRYMNQYMLVQKFIEKKTKEFEKKQEEICSF